MSRTTISVLEALYVLYMFRFFKTTFSMNLLPLKFLDYNEYMIHEKQSTETPVSHICPFGHDMAIVIALYLIIRNYIPGIMKYNKIILGFITFGCLMNLNALLYFLPVIIIELVMIDKNLAVA